MKLQITYEIVGPHVSYGHAFTEVQDALTIWLKDRWDLEHKIAVTDDINFAHKASGSNEFVVLLSEKVETVEENVIVVSKSNILGELLVGLERRCI